MSKSDLCVIGLLASLLVPPGVQSGEIADPDAEAAVEVQQESAGDDVVKLSPSVRVSPYSAEEKIRQMKCKEALQYQPESKEEKQFLNKRLQSCYNRLKVFQ
jgi:hypothetical protein